MPLISEPLYGYAVDLHSPATVPEFPGVIGRRLIGLTLLWINASVQEVSGPRQDHQRACINGDVEL